MADSSISETTHLLRAWAAGDERAMDDLVPRVYRELRRLAGRCLRNERREQTLQISDLVDEAYSRLADLARLDWQHRSHFFAMLATLVRRIWSIARAGGWLASVTADLRELTSGRPSICHRAPGRACRATTPSTSWSAWLRERHTSSGCVVSGGLESTKLPRWQASPPIQLCALGDCRWPGS